MRFGTCAKSLGGQNDTEVQDGCHCVSWDPCSHETRCSLTLWMEGHLQDALRTLGAELAREDSGAHGTQCERE